MAKLVYGMMQSLDGYVDHDKMPPPSPPVFREFINIVAGHAGAIYGRTLYELMQYWDTDQPGWDAPEREFAEVWRRHPKFVASTTLDKVGPNATLIRGDVMAFVKDLKASMQGELDVAGPTLAASLAPLIDEYRLYLRPHVLGSGTPFFKGPRPPLRCTGTRTIDDVVCVTYVPAEPEAR